QPQRRANRCAVDGTLATAERGSQGADRRAQPIERARRRGAGSEPEDQPAARPLVDGGSGGREKSRGPRRQRNDAGAEPDPRRLPARAASVASVSRAPTSGRNRASKPAPSTVRASPASSRHG